MEPELVYLLAAITALAVAGGIALALGPRLVPARWACPRCHHGTTPVATPWLRPLRHTLEKRWCPRCEWSGVGRKLRWDNPGPADGPEASAPFRWAPSPTFRFRAPERAATGGTPSFDTAMEERDGTQPGPEREGLDPDGEGEKDVSPGFTWGKPAPTAPLFVWKDDLPEPPRADRFRWGGEQSREDQG